MQKTCNKCKLEKPSSDFYANSRTADGLNTFCKECHKADSKTRRQVKQQDPQYRQREAERKKQYRLRDRGNHRAYMKDWHIRNAAQQRIYNKKYREERKEYFIAYARNNKAQTLARTRAYQTAKIHRTPKWLTAADYFEMECVYKYCGALRSIGLDYHVDHIIPLQGRTVSGLHVPNNLQVIHASDNLAKSNKWETHCGA